jgi:hypothetical protein
MTAQWAKPRADARARATLSATGFSRTWGVGRVSLRAVLAVIRLRWYVAAVVVFATAVAGWHVRHPKPTFIGICVVVLVPPADPTAPNKLAAVTSSIATAGYMVNLAVMDQSQTNALRQAGVLGDYAITPNNNGTSETPQYDLPSEVLTDQTGDPTTAVSGAKALETAYSQRFDALQAADGVPEDLRINTQVLVPPVAQQVIGSKSRATIAVFLIGLGAMILFPLWFDRWATQRGNTNQGHGRGRGRKRRGLSLFGRRTTAGKAA